jgi:RNA polymerase sigma factor (sigma-70 family)
MTSQLQLTLDDDRSSIYNELTPTVRRLLRQYGKDPEMREDLAGEMYCMFCYHLDRYDSQRGVPLIPYLATQIATSVHTYARRHWRTGNREVALDLNSDLDLRFANDPTLEWTERLEREQMVQALPKALSYLTKRQRTVVLWRLIEERTFEDIAEHLQIAATTARSQLRHGLKNLRAHFADEYPTSPDTATNAYQQDTYCFAPE